MGVDELADAIRAAERYPSLAAEVEAARGLKERWVKRAEAQAAFDAAVDRLSGPAEEALLARAPGAAPSVNAGACSGRFLSWWGLFGLARGVLDA